VDNKNGNNLTERQLVDDVLRGDTQAFATIIRRTEGLVAHVVCKLVSHPEDRKDIAQDVYLKVFKNLSTFRFQSKLSTWIAQIAYNTCLSFLEKKAILVYPDLHSREDGPGEAAFMDADDASSPLFRKERTALLNKAVEQLPPVYQLLLSLYHHEEISYQEISAITRLPEGTVKSYLFRARKMLRAALIHHFKNDVL